MSGKRIAIYGKGGIGKTTISVNLALLLARRGLRTLLVGCDPKKDTARLLSDRPLPALMEKYEALKAARPRRRKCSSRRGRTCWCANRAGRARAWAARGGAYSSPLSG